MKLIHKNEKLVVVDNLIEEDHYKLIWEYTQKENYSMPHTGGWQKVWRLNDAIPMGGPEYKLSEKPFSNEMNLVLAYVEALSKHCSEQLGDWNEIVLRSYLYPRGTKLSWHNDGVYTGAMVIYTHPKWESTWGGELMVAETKGNVEASPHIDHSVENEFLGQFGMGTYITPKPNRAIVTRGDIWHQINRVDADAGDNIRTSIVAFFLKK